ncbi:histidine kinase N-terminal 7TM domain-containing protein [Halorientalis halophila]|uniref:sensor histidine kinase n=1 Tax=Halorientalis halophila TaxID=3108499 RepID=UPI00300B7D3A
MAPSSVLGLLYTGVLLAASVTSVGVAYWVYTIQGVRGSKTFVMILATSVAWSLSVALHVATSNWLVMETIVRLELGFGLLDAALWFVFACQYTGKTLHRRRWVQAALAGTGLAYVGLTLTNPLHHLMWRATPRFTEPFTFVSNERGLAYFAVLAVIYLTVGASFYLITVFLASTRRGTRVRIILLSIAVSLIVGLNALSIVDALPVAGFDHASLGVLPLALAGTAAVFWYDLLDFEPVARNRLIERLEDPVVVLDAGRRVADYNGAAAQLFPAVDEAVGQPFASAFPSLNEQVAFDDREAETVAEVTLDVGGTSRHYSAVLSRIEGDPAATEPVGYAVHLRDITDREEYRQELERQNERLDRFASTVSHDLRNPLSVSNMRAELIEDDVADGHDPERVREHARKIQGANERMETIIDDLLAIARGGAEVSEDDTEQVDLDAAARAAWANVDTGTGSLAVADSVTLTAERSRLLTVFENCFRNSVQHGSDDVTVTVGPLTDGRAGFFVADDGPGIRPEDRDAVLEYGVSERDDGTGLGLAIVETMAEAHGWTTTVTECEDAGGARVEFTGVTLGGDAAGSSESVSDATSSERC